jgi:hypothetical protein
MIVVPRLLIRNPPSPASAGLSHRSGRTPHHRRVASLEPWLDISVASFLPRPESRSQTMSDALVAIDIGCSAKSPVELKEAGGPPAAVISSRNTKGQTQ